MAFNWRLDFLRRRGVPSDARTQMIQQTQAFLNWALGQDHPLPRIPTIRVDQGGYDELLRRPGAREAANAWWERVLGNGSPHEL